MMQTIEMTYQVAIYLRLSKEDGDFSSSSGKKAESDSISNQRELIGNYMKEHPELELVDEFCDDGYTGTNFDRPDFIRMMEAVKGKRVNCIIVKDLSRFGREYIEAGNYIEKIFPQLGIRFIAINDHYDSAATNSQADGIILPFKNLINDSYSRDTSIKVRSHLDVKRRQGEFIGNFAVYGYLKDPEDKNHLVVDEYAAKVVQDIYQWKIEGLSPDKIAERLTKKGIASPMEYKKARGSRYACAFKTGSQARWSHVAVRRILQNEVYTGVLTQGKRTTPNYKVKKSIYKAESEWARVENTHEAIISRKKFDLVQQLLREDTRVSPDGDTVYPYSGRIFCGDCKEAAVRKSVSTGGRKYTYYVCSANKANRSVCSKHSIREDILDAAILATVQAHIKVILDMDQALQQIEALAWEKRELKKIEANIAMQQAVIDKNSALRIGIYEDLKEEIITKEEFLTLKEEFTERIREAERSIKQYEQDKSSILAGFHDQQGWLAQFRQYKNISEITRKVVVNLIERINVFEGQQIEVVFKQKDQFAGICAFLESQKKTEKGAVILLKKEAV